MSPLEAAAVAYVAACDKLEATGHAASDSKFDVAMTAVQLHWKPFAELARELAA